MLSNLKTKFLMNESSQNVQLTRNRNESNFRSTYGQCWERLLRSCWQLFSTLGIMTVTESC